MQVGIPSRHQPLLLVFLAINSWAIIYPRMINRRSRGLKRSFVFKADCFSFKKQTLIVLFVFVLEDVFVRKKLFFFEAINRNRLCKSVVHTTSPAHSLFCIRFIAWHEYTFWPSRKFNSTKYMYYFHILKLKFYLTHI